MIDLTEALGAALAPAPVSDSTTRRTTSLESGARTLGAKKPAPPPPSTPAPVFQIAALPLIVDPAAYANAHTNTNPNGSFVTLRALRDLVDPVPLFSRTYQAGLRSTEGQWSNLLAGASGSTSYANGVLGSARQAFATAALPGLDGLPGQWRPVYALPENWTDLTNDAAFRTVTVDLTGRTSGATTTRLSTIGGGDAALEWTTVDSTGGSKKKPLSKGTSVDAIVLEIRQVTLQRPWLDPGLFSTDGIAVAGLRAGSVSTGDLNANDGVLPLLPTAFWLARSATLRGTLAPTDQAMIDGAADDTHVSLAGIAIAGPAADVVAGGGSATGQVVAWTSSLVPRWPA